MTATLVIPQKKEGKILFLHGWFSDGSSKSNNMTLMGYDVCTPKLSDWSFKSALRAAKAAMDEFCPDVIVGSSRGSAVAMNLDTDKPLILLAPAWKQFGSVDKVKNQNSVVIHSPKDNMVPYKDSLELYANSPGLILYAAGNDHTLNDQEACIALQESLEHCFRTAQFMQPG